MQQDQKADAVPGLEAPRAETSEGGAHAVARKAVHEVGHDAGHEAAQAHQPTLEDIARMPDAATPDTVDGVAFARLYGEPLFQVPDGLYIPPDALKVFLESFEGPLDLLLYLIRRQKFDVMEIPMALVTEQYMGYVELIRKSNLELAADYLVMAAHLMQIKSQLLLPVTKVDTGEEVEDPQAELARRLLEYERMKMAAVELDQIPRVGRDFFKAFVLVEQSQAKLLPEVNVDDLVAAWHSILRQASLTTSHKISRQELNVREFMSAILKRLATARFIDFEKLFDPQTGRAGVIVNYLAILELAKEGLIRITQAAPFAPIYVSGVSPLDEDDPGARAELEPQVLS